MVQNLARQNDLLKRIKALHKEVSRDSLEKSFLEQESRVSRTIHSVSSSPVPRVRKASYVKENKERVYHNFFYNSFGKKTIWENILKYTSVLQGRLKKSQSKDDKKLILDSILRARSAC
jgi:hypothetical protein